MTLLYLSRHANSEHHRPQQSNSQLQTAENFIRYLRSNTLVLSLSRLNTLCIYQTMGLMYQPCRVSTLHQVSRILSRMGSALDEPVENFPLINSLRKYVTTSSFISVQTTFASLRNCPKIGSRYGAHAIFFGFSGRQRSSIMKLSALDVDQAMVYWVFFESTFDKQALWCIAYQEAKHNSEQSLTRHAQEHPQ